MLKYREYIKAILTRLGFNTNSKRKLISFIRNRDMVWHFCTPKCASTSFLYNVKEISKLNNRVKSISPCLFGQNRPQVIDAYHIKSQINNKQKVYYCERSHTLPSSDVQSLISDKHTVILQYRGILDTITSIIDHMDRAPSKPWANNAEYYWSNLTYDEKVQDLIIQYVPFHLTFIQGWLVAGKHINVKWIKYDDYVQNKYKCFKYAFQDYDLKLPDTYSNLTKKQENFNLGIKGRGQNKITNKHQEEIVELINKMDYLNQNLINYL
jgi:hypothetical protein